MFRTERREGLAAEVMWRMSRWRNAMKSDSHFEHQLLKFKLLIKFRHWFYASVESTMIILEQLVSLKHYLSPAVDSSTLKVVDLCPTMLNDHPSTTLHTDNIIHAHVCHMTSDTKPSLWLFCVYIIEKLDILWSTWLGYNYINCFSGWI